MFEVSKFNMGGQDIYVKDAEARRLISNLQNDVAQKNEQLTNNIAALDLRTKNVINFDYTVFVGDGYLTGHGLDSPGTQNWGKLFSQHAGCSKTYFLGNASMGFCNPGHNGKNAVEYIEQSAASVPDRPGVTCVVCCMGLSDREYKNDDIETNVRAFWQAVGRLYPKAKKVFLVNPAFGCMSASKLYTMYDTAAFNGVITVDSWWWLLLHYGQFQADRFNPNYYGQARIAQYLYTNLLGGKVYTGINSNMSLGGGWTVDFKTECDKIQLLVAGNYPEDTNEVKVGEFAEGMFQAIGANDNTPPDNFNTLAFMDNGYTNIGLVLWRHGDRGIYVRALTQTGTSGEYSHGYFKCYQEISPAILFG